jgi:hypothetical protein
MCSLSNILQWKKDKKDSDNIDVESQNFAILDDSEVIQSS